jgi:chromosome partitioning protein
MSRVIALFNQAGGVGKSSVTMNLGYSLAQHDRRVLLIDLDPQASLTLFMGLEPSELKHTIYESLLADQPLAIHSNLHGMDLVPANIRLSGAELELVTADMRDMRLKDALQPAHKNYDFILIDCPPSLGILSYISLVAAEYVLVPIQTQYKAFCGAEMLLSTVARVRSRANRTLKIAEFGKIFAPIVRATAFADAAEAHQPLALYSPRHPSLEILDTIATHLTTLP